MQRLPQHAGLGLLPRGWTAHPAVIIWVTSDVESVRRKRGNSWTNRVARGGENAKIF